MQKQTIPTRRFHFRPIWFLLLIAFLFVLCGVLLTFTLHSQASTNMPPQVHATTATTVTKVPQHASFVTPTASQVSTNKTMGPLQPTVTPVRTIVVATPTLIESTPQQTQFGVFALSSGGPLPVPESILHPTNIARVMLGSTLVSVYAGSMSSNPQAGILCVLREDITTGQLHLQVYQGPQTGGALTILSFQKSVLKVVNTKMQGSFDLNTNTFQW